MFHEHRSGIYKLKSIHLSILFSILSLCAVVTGVFARMWLIDSILSDTSAVNITYHIACITMLILLEHFFSEAMNFAELNSMRKNKFKMVELAAGKSAKLSLTQLENKYTQEIHFKAAEYYQKSLDYTKAIGKFVSLFYLL